MTKRKSYAKAVLTNLHALRERRYVGDLDASDTLIDFERAVKAAKLTARQAEAISLVYDVGLTQKAAAEHSGRSREDIKMALKESLEKIEDIYEMWAWLGGELSAEDFNEEEAI